MRVVNVKRVLLLALMLAVVSCDRSPAAKFRPGDKVRTITEAEGVVCLRTRLFRDDVYFVTIRGPRLVEDCKYSSWDEWNYSGWRVACTFVSKLDAYDSGPYDAADLRLVSR
jgi:hypothetical protein